MLIRMGTGSGVPLNSQLVGVSVSPHTLTDNVWTRSSRGLGTVVPLPVCLLSDHFLAESVGEDILMSGSVDIDRGFGWSEESPSRPWKNSIWFCSRTQKKQLRAKVHIRHTVARRSGASAGPQFYDSHPCDKPSALFDEPSGSSDQPAGSFDEPAALLDWPAGSSDQPSGSSDEPSGSSDQPSALLDWPAGAFDEPSVLFDKP